MRKTDGGMTFAIVSRETEEALASNLNKIPQPWAGCVSRITRVFVQNQALLQLPQARPQKKVWPMKAWETLNGRDGRARGKDAPLNATLDLVPCFLHHRGLRLALEVWIVKGRLLVYNGKLSLLEREVRTWLLLSLSYVAVIKSPRLETYHEIPKAVLRTNPQIWAFRTKRPRWVFIK